ncbi:MAG: adenylate/guanylate cyclase domain-containing protein [Actinobacteria bacterium]|nr:MAG: adenylate/guanylate cyclase domain-containing protein [Actinomycetota bacterium]
MRRMEGLSAEVLADRAGASVEHVERLARLGILTPHPDGSFRPSDIQRVKLVDALERSGIATEDIGRAITSGHLSLAFLDLLFTEPKGYSSKTYRDLCAEYGWSMEFVERMHEALGLPTPLPEDRVREDDLQMFPVGQFVRSTGVPDAGVIRALRVYGENLGRITRSESQFFHTYVEEPMLTSGAAENVMLEITAQISPMMRAQVEGMIDWLYHRHQEHAIIEHVVGHVEEALEQAGVTPRRQGPPPAMVFLDLTGYTRLTEERGDDAAAELAASLASLVQRESQRRGGRPVKWLGDGVMFHFPDPGQAVDCSLDLVEKAPASGMPPAHVGVNAGPVIFRDGDYFGRTVNVASRIAGRAGPGEVLVSEETVSAISGRSVRFEGIGPVELKGLAKPLELFRALRG